MAWVLGSSSWSCAFDRLSQTSSSSGTRPSLLRVTFPFEQTVLCLVQGKEISYIWVHGMAQVNVSRYFVSCLLPPATCRLFPVCCHLPLAFASVEVFLCEARPPSPGMSCPALSYSFQATAGHGRLGGGGAGQPPPPTALPSPSSLCCYFSLVYIHDFYNSVAYNAHMLVRVVLVIRWMISINTAGQKGHERYETNVVSRAMNGVRLM